MTGVAVITAIYDGFDTLKPVCPQEEVADWVLVTDRPPADSLGWRVVLEPCLGFPPSRAAKVPKCLPWLFTEAPASVYLDASYRVTSPALVAGVLAAAAPLAQFVHPWRDCALAEAEFSAGLPKYAGQPLAAQAACYREAGHPDHWGLWASGVIGRWHTEEVRKAGEAWLGEIAAWSLQCQVSEPYVLRNLGLRPAPLPGNHLGNPWLSYEGSARH